MCNKKNLCSCKIALASAVVVISLLGLSLATPEIPGAYGFGASNIALVLTTPNWWRRPKGLCWMKALVVLSIIAFMILLPILVPVVTKSPIGLLCIAGALVAIMPALAYTAAKETGSRGKS